MNSNVAIYANWNHFQWLGIVWMVVVFCLPIAALRAEKSFSRLQYSMMNSALYKSLRPSLFWIIFFVGLLPFYGSSFSLFCLKIFAITFAYFIFVFYSPKSVRFAMSLPVILIPLSSIFSLTDFTNRMMTVFLASIFIEFINGFESLAMRTIFIHFNSINKSPSPCICRSVEGTKHLHKAMAIYRQIKNAFNSFDNRIITHKEIFQWQI